MWFTRFLTTKSYLICFLLLTISYFLLATAGHGTIAFYLKPLPAWLTAFWLFCRSGGEERWGSLGFFFAGVGDVIGDLGFFYGQLFFFLIGHLLLIASFVPRFFFSLRVAVTWAVLLIALVWDASHILPTIEPLFMKGMIVAYLCAIATMAATAVAQRASFSGWLAWLIGSGLFIFSDSVIAWSKFVQSVPNRFYWVMITYYLAIFFLALGFRSSFLIQELSISSVRSDE